MHTIFLILYNHMYTPTRKWRFAFDTRTFVISCVNTKLYNYMRWKIMLLYRPICLEQSASVSPSLWVFCIIHHHHLSLNRKGRWVTTDEFATRFLHFSLFSNALWDLSIPWCCLPTSSSVCLVFFPLSLCLVSPDVILCGWLGSKHQLTNSLCLARWFRPDLINGRHDHTTAVCVSLRSLLRQCGSNLGAKNLPRLSWQTLEPRTSAELLFFFRSLLLLLFLLWLTGLKAPTN